MLRSAAATQPPWQRLSKHRFQAGLSYDVDPVYLIAAGISAIISYPGGLNQLLGYPDGLRGKVRLLSKTLKRSSANRRR